MKAGKKTYINKAKEIMAEWGYASKDCFMKSGMATEQACFDIGTVFDVKVVYEPYEEHIFKIRLNIEDVANDIALFSNITYKYGNVYTATPVNEFQDKDEFDRYLRDIFNEWLPQTIEKVKRLHTSAFKSAIKTGKGIKKVVKSKTGKPYVLSMDLTPEEIDRIYEITGDDDFMAEELKELFVF